MIISRQDAIIELDETDRAKFLASESYREKVFDVAVNLSDDTDRTVSIYVTDSEDVGVHTDSDFDRFEADALAALAVAVQPEREAQ